MARKHNIARFHQFYSIISRQRVCVYCGVRATTIDHFVPLSVVAILADAMSAIPGRVLVPACGECNAMAGDGIFPTVAAKRRFIREKIKKKYRKVIAAPDWSSDEIANLGYTMSTFILAGKAQKEWLRQRLAWHNGMNSEPVQLAKIRSNLGALGRRTATTNANSGATT